MQVHGRVEADPILPKALITGKTPHRIVKISTVYSVKVQATVQVGAKLENTTELIKRGNVLSITVASRA